MPTRISAAYSSTWEEESREKASGNEDGEGFTIVEECVMKYAAGGCFDHARCDLCDHD